MKYPDHEMVEWMANGCMSPYKDLPRGFSTAACLGALARTARPEATEENLRNNPHWPYG